MRSRDQASSHPLLLVFECWETYLLSLDWALLAYWQKSSPKKSSCSTRFVCWCHKGGLEEELPDSMLELRSFLTLPMKPEIRVGIGEASFRSPWFLRFGVGYSINSVREVIDVRLGFRPPFKVLGIDWIIPVLLLDRVIESDAVPLIEFHSIGS